MFFKFVVRILSGIFVLIGTLLSIVVLTPIVIWFEWNYNHKTFEDSSIPQTFISQPKSGQCYSQYDAQGKYHSDPQITKCR